MTHSLTENQRSRPAKGAVTIEQPELTLGFMPLTDCAPLVAALERGFFAEQGLHVTLSREVSWANIRDKVAAAELDGAQMLAPMPLAASLPNSATGAPLVTAMSLGLNGNIVGVSTELHAAMSRIHSAAGPGERLAVLARQRRDQGQPLRLGMVYPHSTHNYLLRYWLAAQGLHPDRDVRLEVVPPPFMVEALAAGEIEGFCVGEPWGGLAMERGVGAVLLADHAIWNHHPEKVFAVTEEWAKRHPATHQALLVALIKACQWLDEPEHREDIAAVLERDTYVGVPRAIIGQGLRGNLSQGRVDACNVFFRHGATFPWRSHALWLLTQMSRWGQIGAPLALRPMAERVYRTDLYREAAISLGLACPARDDKQEGRHDEPHDFPGNPSALSLGTDRFCDGRGFDPDDPIGYLADSQIHSRRGAIDAWRQANL